MMKKILLFVILFLLLNVSVLDTPNIINYNDTLRYDYIYIKADNLTLDNLKDRIKGVDIVAVDFYINPVYKEHLQLNYTNKDNLKEKYLSYLKENNMYSEYNKFLVKPIKINRVLVYSNLSSLNELNLL
jgi:hypothetical protein